MKKLLKKAIALTLALALCVTQLVLPVLAETTGEAATPVTTVEVDVTSLPGGTLTEEVEVDIVVTNNTDGTITATAQTAPGGDVTESGSTVNYESEVVTDAAGTVLSEDTAFSVSSADGSYTAQGGTESTTVVDPGTNAADTDVTVMEGGTVVDDPTAGGVSTSTVQPGSVLESEDPANFDQTIVTETTREVSAQITDTTVTAGDPTFVDENGDPLPDTEDGYNYTGANDRPDRLDKNGYHYSVTWTDENGEKVSSSAVRRWTITEEETKEVVDNLYCVDGSISGKPYGQYRLVNLEDAVEEDYYSEEDAAHLRAIMTIGFNWDPDNLDKNLQDMNQRLQTAGVLQEGEELNYRQAAAATNISLWRYGNRYDVDSADLVPQLNGLSDEEEALILKVYSYLSEQTMEAPQEETQVINQEKFIDDMVFSVGSKTENNTYNQDDISTNDVYDTSVKFSMVVTPDARNDDLVVKILDDQGNVVKSARIAGENQQGGEQHENARQITEDGKTYYVIEGLELQENSDTVFNLKLEGYQLLEKGVYVFEAMSMSKEQLYHYYAEMNGCTAAEIESMLSGYDEETIQQLMRSQNFIGVQEGTADVDVSVQVDLTFNVEEATITTEHSWRSEQTAYSYTETGGGTPRMGRRMLQNIADEEVPLAEEPDAELEVEEELDETITIPDEEVPLAAAPATGDFSILWSVMGMMGLGGTTALTRKIRKTEDEE